MDCGDRALLDEWMSRWADLVHFEVVPVITSAEAAAAVAPQL
jgi:siroheme synthase